jgi:hypothetical protein
VARLTTDGIFTDVDTVRLESEDSYSIQDGGHTLVARFHTYDGIDGVNFSISGGTKLHLSLFLNGSLISPNNIYLGVAGTHSAHNPFLIYR